jgi:hypothetical protein
VSGNVTVDHWVDPEGWENHRGQWVAIRGDEIVAAAVTLDELFADERYQPDDVLWRVPEAGIHFYAAAVPV